MKTLLPALALTAAAVISAAPAFAGSTHYLNGNGGLATSHTIVSDCVEITATATAYDPKKGKTHEAHVGQYRNGLGVTNSVYTDKWGKTRSNDGSHTVDGKGYDDTVWLSFNKPFTVMGAIFSYAGRYDDVKVVDGDGKLLGKYDLGNLCDRWGVACLDLSGLNYTGTKIGFTAYGDHDSWKLKAIKGEKKHEAVPTPSAAAAGMLGLAALTARRRRKIELENDNA